MKVFAFSLLVLTAISGLAKADGLEAAEKLCSKLFYSDEKQKCLGVVQKATSLDEQAVEVCGSLFYVEEKLKCLSVIKNLKFTQTSIDVCKREFYSDNKIACLGKAGRAAESLKEERNDLDKAYVRNSLRKALQAIQERDSRKAQQIIENLIDTL